MNTIANKLIKTVQALDAKGANNEFNSAIERTVINAVEKSEPLNFVSFTCSTIDSEYLWSDKPWLYVSTDPKGNNLEPDLARITEVIGQLKEIYPATELKILVGNTDPYYIYLQQFRNFPKADRKILIGKFNERWETYRKNFSEWVSGVAAGIDPQVISWYQFEKDIESRAGKSFEIEYEQAKENIVSYFSKDKFDWELRKLQTQFGSGKYFEKLEKPDYALLKDWIMRKFAEYAVQAKWIYENIPNAILIQNEKPSDLRSQMYQPLVCEKYGVGFPITYFLGVDNTGYQ